MRDFEVQNFKTYNESAKKMAEKFDRIGARKLDIDETFNLLKKENPLVVELGCGNGRDAEEILKKTENYLGIDFSPEMIELARKRVAGVEFQIGKIEKFNFPQKVDVVIAFASLIHLPLDMLKDVAEKIFLALNENGVVRISMKESPEYQIITKTDQFGTRTYYHYSLDELLKIFVKFKVRKAMVEEYGGQRWVELLLRK